MHGMTSIKHKTSELNSDGQKTCSEEIPENVEVKKKMF
jgi:hypothetical protein